MKGTWNERRILSGKQKRENKKSKRNLMKEFLSWKSC